MSINSSMKLKGKKERGKERKKEREGAREGGSHQKKKKSNRHIWHVHGI